MFIFTETLAPMEGKILFCFLRKKPLDCARVDKKQKRLE